MVVMSIIVAIYYNVIMAYTLFFTFASFQGGAAPWTQCHGTAPPLSLSLSLFLSPLLHLPVSPPGLPAPGTAISLQITTGLP